MGLFERFDLKFGVMMGGLLALNALLTWIFGILVFMSLKSFTGFVIYAVITVLSLQALRKSQDGTLSFSEGFKLGWVVGFIGLTISMVFHFVLGNVIDPSLSEQIKTYQLEILPTLSSVFTQEQLDLMVDRLEESDVFSMAYLVNEWASTLVMAAVFSVLLALILKRN